MVMWVPFVVAPMQSAIADEGVLATVQNMRIVYSATEPRPNQYQIFLKSEQTGADASCSLFIAHIKTRGGREQAGGELESVASFLVEPNDFPVSVWLTDLRVESWSAWRAQNADRGASSYGNPCLESKNRRTTPVAQVDLPRNPAMPCDSVPVNIAGVSAVQHLAIGGDSLRIEITQPDSNAAYLSKVSDIDLNSIAISDQGPLVTLSFVSKAGTVETVDRNGPQTFPAPRLQIVCRTDADAAAIRDLLLRR
jgi:hypothetical protein